MNKFDTSSTGGRIMNCLNGLVYVAKWCDVGTIKVYDNGTDWQCITTGGVKFPELWFTKHWYLNTNTSLQYAIDKTVSYNCLTDIEEVKRLSYNC